MNFWTSFYDRFLSDPTYEHLATSELLSLPLIVIGAFVGIALACILYVFTKRFLGEAVRGLIAAEALSPESAKTLAELGLDKKPFLRRALKKSVSVRRVVYCREEEEFLRKQEEERSAHEELRKTNRFLKKFRDKEFRADPKSHHFYIPEELKETANTKFDKKGTSFVSLAIVLVALLVLMIVALIGLPELMKLLDNFVGTMKSAAASGNDQILQ